MEKLNWKTITKCCGEPYQISTVETKGGGFETLIFTMSPDMQNTITSLDFEKHHKTELDAKLFHLHIIQFPHSYIQ